MTKTERLIGIVTLLLRERKTTLSALAEHFEVSYRTIYRDIEAISQAGIPVITLQGYGGGVQLDERYLLDQSLLSHEDIRMILAGLKGIESVSSELKTKELINKLMLNQKIITDKHELVMIDLASFYKSDLTKKFDLISEAILARQILEFKYYSEKGVSSRCIEPYLILFKWSAWYLYGFCRKRQDFRLFKLNRISVLQNTSHTFTRRQLEMQEDHFDYLSDGTIHLKALFDLSEHYRLVDEYGLENTSNIQGEKIYFEWSFTNYTYVKNWLLSFGASVKILEPLQLAQDLHHEAAKMIQFYQEYDS